MDDILEASELDGLDLEEALGLKETPEPEGKSAKAYKRYGARHLSRKAASEAALENALDWHWEEGDCYHCFSFGDVDAMSYLKMVVRQQRVDYVALSTWCMAGEDVDQLREWHRRGLVGRVDFFVGEIFRASYSAVYAEILGFIEECGGRLVAFRNHAKLFVVEGSRFDVLIESSANINTNPRSENTVVTVDRQLVADYIRLLAEIRPYNQKEAGAAPYFGRGHERRTGHGQPGEADGVSGGGHRQAV